MIAFRPSPATRMPFSDARRRRRRRARRAAPARGCRCRGRRCPMTAPTSASIEPGERSMCREMIENVIAIATTASGAFCATIDCSVRSFSHDGSIRQKTSTMPTVIAREEPDVEVAAGASDRRSRRPPAEAAGRRAPRAAGCRRAAPAGSSADAADRLVVRDHPDDEGADERALDPPDAAGGHREPADQRRGDRAELEPGARRPG